ncbi:MAG: hypothetical protein HFH92_05205 [Lachnospiraceae bacterium]|nr:hypothetical protein [Lachnospiraceae bacterium]
MAKMEARLPGTKTAFSTFAGKAFADKNFAGKNFAGKKFCGQKILLDTRTGIPYSGT